MKGTLLAVGVSIITVILILIGTLSPIPSAAYYAGGKKLPRASSTPQGAVDNLVAEIRQRAFDNAYSSLANKAEFTEPQFVQDLTGNDLSLRTFATLDNYEIQPLHASADDAEMVMKLKWSTVVGPFENTRTGHIVRNGARGAGVWPVVKTPHAP